MSLLTVEQLNVRFHTPDGEVHAVRDLSFAMEAGETLGIVGESGSGKSQTMMAVMGLLAANGRIEGSVRYRGEELVGMPVSQLRAIRGRKISMIFQDPMTSMNPYMTVFDQMAQVLIHHEGLSRRAARSRCVEMLEAVRIPEAGRRIDMYPHEFSGGMRQRVMIASALLCRPDLLIADEPTTALDVTVQAQILDLMREVRREFGTAIILITHDLGVVAGLCERVLVMNGGQEMESGEVRDIFYRPQHAYTRALLAAVPRLDEQEIRRLATVDPSGAARAAAASDPAEDAGAAAPADGIVRSEPDLTAPPLLDVSDLRVHFRLIPPSLFAPAPLLKAVDGVDLVLRPGETLGVVGESGCGKSTLARAVLRLVPATSGRISLLGDDITLLDRLAMRTRRRDMQVIFQDPLASLNPRMTVGDIVAEPLHTHYPRTPRKEIRERVSRMLTRVGLGPQIINRYPHEFSGGQCQRIGIARALVLEPELVVCDEPVSALDVSIQAQIVNLLMDIQAEMNLALIFIAHDLAVVRHISHRIMVMYLGRVVEISDRVALYERPMHPYTQALIRSVPIPDPDRERNKAYRPLQGDLPSPVDPPSGCTFRTRCPHVVARCAEEVPVLRQLGASLVACHEAERVRAAIDRGEAA
ncbi:MAG: ABC transporter ATP-binding protein [Gammaproteobacteria bacterium]|nr:ABC transporter ATP-binding protein [Gammaproteobacteria bacterium]TVQ47783.1 MAG: ABC transporter ATP-binding protein [Gammaproteobacteria bacterium]